MFVYIHICICVHIYLCVFCRQGETERQRCSNFDYSKQIYEL